LECGFGSAVSLLDQFPATPMQRLLGDVELVTDLPVRNVRLEQCIRQPATLVNIETPVRIGAAKVKQKTTEVSNIVEFAPRDQIDLAGTRPFRDVGETADSAHKRHPRTLSDA